jgi:hypothetical protein
MKFFFPDSQDLISPTYDFVHDEYVAHRVRQRDDVYAHEVLNPVPFDGLLVSKAIVDGSAGNSAKYTNGQRERLYRLGAQEFFRLPPGLETLGDCGAFNYVTDPKPPYSVQEVADFYEGCSFSAGVSVDHVILGFDKESPDYQIPDEWRRRQAMSLRLAAEFLEEVNRRKQPFIPVGAAQGWSPKSYAQSVRELQEMGYCQVALGGMVPLKTPDILACLEAISLVRKPETNLHLLGVTRVQSMEQFATLGVTSFDSTSPFRQAFMDDRNNYHTLSGSYVAIRIPQVDGNAALKKLILSGTVRQSDAINLERESLSAVKKFDEGLASREEVLNVLSKYELLLKPRRSYIADYDRMLSDVPWKHCTCGVCKSVGVEVAIFRGTERNKRRGFHNLHVFREKIEQIGVRRVAE